MELLRNRTTLRNSRTNPTLLNTLGQWILKLVRDITPHLPLVGLFSVPTLPEAVPTRNQTLNPLPLEVVIFAALQAT